MTRVPSVLSVLLLVHAQIQDARASPIQPNHHVHDPIEILARAGSGSSSTTATTFSTVPDALTQTATATAIAGTTGSLVSSLETSGRTSIVPFNTQVQPTASGTLQPIFNAAEALPPVVATPAPQAMTVANVFAPIDNAGPPANIPHISSHPVPRTGISSSMKDPIGTNKFYANLFLGNQNQGVWTHPYSVVWAKGSGNTKSWGLSISHIDSNQYAYADGNPSQYFLSPLGIQSMVMSALELTSSTVLTTDTLRAYSVNCNLGLPGKTPLITFPLVQGMGFVTGIYRGATPMIQSGVYFKTFSGPSIQGNTYKYNVVLQDGKSWIIYVTPSPSSTSYIDKPLKLVTSSLIRGSPNFSGTIQIAKNPNGAAGEAVYDKSAGAYPLYGNVGGSVSGSTGTYTFSWTKVGVTSKKLLMFALPHHVDSFDSASFNSRTAIQLQTTTKGVATAILADKWTMVESSLPVDMGFAPWTPLKRNIVNFSAAAKDAINKAASAELNQDINGQAVLDSMYFSGKGLAKFAFILFATRDIANNTALASAGLTKLKAAFSVFVNNKQQNPLVYDDQWKGVVSKAGYSDQNADFGNTYFNDHHFHYGYFVYTAAVIAYLDPSWLSQGTNKAWVQMLVKDFANPVMNSYAPLSRSFDWYHGHSWAKGLFESADGKDEESSSEDAFASYAIKMWGKSIGDKSMEARGNLMLAIQSRTLPAYFLMESTNKNQPARFIGNKVTGILFENKADHATYFGLNIEYIQGIHMIPLGPHSAATRRTSFVQEEWDTFFSNGRVDTIQGGWRGILYANYALINPKAAYNFFAQPNFDQSWLDGGASRTWYLTWCAGLGGL